MHYAVNMNEYERFTELILEKVRTYFKGLDQNEFFETLEGSLWGFGEKPNPPRLTKEEEFYLEIFLHFGEINTSMENLDYIPVFINQPFRKSKVYQEAGITRNSYLRYHVEHYLAENALLKNRVIRFLVKLSKMLLKDGKAEESKFILTVKDSFLKSMKRLTKIRNSHIHEIRFDEEKLNRLTGLELLSTSSQDENLELVTVFFYRIVKKEWSERIINNNKSLKEMINATFGVLIPIIFPSEARVAE